MGEYWQGFTGWSKLSGPNVPFARVLEESGLTQDRYNRYMSVLSAFGAERVTFVRLSGAPPRTELLLYRSGMVFSGCVMDLTNERLVPDAGQGENGQVTALADGWFVRYACV